MNENTKTILKTIIVFFIGFPLVLSLFGVYYGLDLKTVVSIVVGSGVGISYGLGINNLVQLKIKN